MIGAVVVMVAIPLLVVSIYVRTDAFNRKLNETLVELTNGSIELSESVEVSQWLPQLKLSLPGAKLRTQGVLRRARFSGLELDTSVLAVLSRGARGSAVLRIADASLIVSSSNTESSSGGADAADAMATIFDVAENTVSSPVLGMRALLQIDELDLLVRDSQRRTSRFTLTDVQLSATESAVELHSHVDHGNSPTPLSVVVRDIRAKSDELAASVQIQHGAQDSETSFASILSFTPDSLTVRSIEVNDAALEAMGELTLIQADHAFDIDGAITIQSLLPLELYSRLSKAEEVPAARLFSYTPIGWKIPRDVSGTIDVRFGSVNVGDISVLDGDTTLSFKDGVGSLRADELVLFGGVARLGVDVDSRAELQTGMSLRIDATDLELDRFRLPDDEGPVINTGKADLIVSLRGSGSSPGMIASSIDGYVLAAVEDAEFNRRYSTAIDRGLVTWGLERLSLISSRMTEQDTGARLSDRLSIDCAALRMYLNDGRAEVSNGAIFELPDNTLYSSGYIDLRTEKLGFAFRTRRKSLFDWSAISIVKYLELGGTLVSPTIDLNEGELVKQGVLTASSAAWGPLPSLVYKLGEAGLRNRGSMECVRSID